MGDELILEPLKAYKSDLKDKFEQNTKDLLENLIQKSGVNEDENAATVDAYDKLTVKVNEASQKTNAARSLRGFIVFLSVLGFIALAVGALVAYNGFSDSSVGTGIAGIAVGVVGLALGVGMIVLIRLKLNNMVAQREAALAKLKAEADEQLQKAYAQTRPLCALFDWGMTGELIQKTVPILQIDRNFDVRKSVYLKEKYGFEETTDEDFSTTYLLSGSIVGNPFIFVREYISEMGTRSYSGSLTVHWTEYHTDSEGHAYEDHKSQTLTATVIKPCPYYRSQTSYLYGNEAAPDLSFSRSPQVAGMSESQMQRKIKREEKKLEKMEKKAVSSGDSSFTAMTNSTFDALFGAKDRDNEIQFRLLFTPLAQRNMEDLIQSKEFYGDDFSFVKNRKINTLWSSHMQNWQMETNPGRFYHYSIAEIRKTFMEFNVNYFQSFYFDLAPVLSIPLYQQQKPKEYIYKDDYPRNCSWLESEVMANSFDSAYFAPQDAATDSILKTRLVTKDDSCDRIAVSARAYSANERVDYVSVGCDDGNYYNVAVPWIEYLPTEKTTMMEMTTIDEPRSSFDEKASSNPYISFMNKNAYNGAASCQRGLLAFILGSNWTGAESKELQQIFAKTESAESAEESARPQTNEIPTNE